MRSKSFRELGVALVALSAASAASAAGFSAGLSPTRFELKAEPGDVLRDTLTIVNPGEAAAGYQFRTADWQLNELSSVEFAVDELQEGSCRPWVRLERRDLEIGAGEQKIYRFEVHVPEDAEPGLCRFAILVEPAEAYLATVGDGLTVPVVGRYAVITYVTIGDAAPVVELGGISIGETNGQRMPALELTNSGNDLARATGQVTATDLSGRRVSLIPSNFPVLPGRTEMIPLFAEPEVGGTVVSVELDYPIRLDGRIEVGGEQFRIEATLRETDSELSP